METFTNLFLVHFNCCLWSLSFAQFAQKTENWESSPSSSEEKTRFQQPNNLAVAEFISDAQEKQKKKAKCHCLIALSHGLQSFTMTEFMQTKSLVYHVNQNFYKLKPKSDTEDQKMKS